MLSATGCSVLQPGDKEDALGRILDARHPSGALLGTDSSHRPSPEESLARYMSLVNQIHPERCMDGRAQQAFMRASQAYDALCSADSGFDSTNAWEDAKSGSTSSSSGARWWESRSLADIQMFLEFRSAALKALYTEIAPNLGAPGMASTEHLNKLIEDAERTCEHLDRKKGIPRNRFWHIKSDPTRPARRAEEAAVHYVDLLCHLRGLHCFCLLQGRQFLHFADLHAASPMTKLSTLLQESLLNQRSKEKLEKELAASNEEDLKDADVDPLDRFMASLEEEVKQEGVIEPPEKMQKSAPDGTTKDQSNGREDNQHMDAAKEAECSAHRNVHVASNGKPVHLTAEAADAEKRAAASALLAEEGKACAQRDLQNHLLGELASDESDADQ